MRRAVAFALVASASMAACGRGNGLPPDITSHLSEHGITVEPSRIHAPLSLRAGYIVARHDSLTAARIIAEFGLDRIQAESSEWRMTVDLTGGEASPEQLWGLSGRPSQFRLTDGGQFEYFYLLITADGWMYLLAEYAYG